MRKRQRRLDGVDGIVLSLSAKGLTTGEISAHLAEVYGASVSKDTISAITDRVIDAMAEWQSRPLDPVYPVVFVDAIRVKIRDGNVVNRPIYLAMGVTVDGERDILGLWAGEHGDGEGAKFWLRVLTEIKNRGVRDVLMLVCDGLKGLPDSVNTVWEATIVQTCVVHLLRNSFRYASKRDWPELAKDLKPIYTAPSGRRGVGPVRRVLREVGDAATRRSFDCGQTRGPSSCRSSRSTWRSARSCAPPTPSSRSTPGCAAPCSARGHFPTEQAALKCLYMALMGLDPTGRGRGRWVMRWKAALNAFDIAFDGRLSAGRN